MDGLEKINALLSEAKVFYIVTVDGDKPKARPISFKLLKDGKLWFGVGTFKEVYRQLAINPHIEIVASTPHKWLRYDGIAHFVDDPALESECLDLLGPIGDMYRKNGWRMGMFYLEQAHAEIKAAAKTIDEFDL